jgi:hypothetical protein
MFVFGHHQNILKPKEVTPFIFSKDGRPYHKQRLQRSWIKANRIAREAHGIPMIHVKNAFRHSMASQLINAGVPIEPISKMLGHSSIKMTESIYANILPETAWGKLLILKGSQMGRRKIRHLANLDSCKVAGRETRFDSSSPSQSSSVIPDDYIYFSTINLNSIRIINIYRSRSSIYYGSQMGRGRGR